MRRFVALYEKLDRTTRTNEKVAALKQYFTEAPPADAAWALYVLGGGRLIRAVSHRDLRTWASQVSGYPMWLIDESYNAVGDLSETLSLLLPGDGGADDEPLHRLIEGSILPLPRLDEAGRRAMITGVWDRLGRQERFLFHKLISGTFRVGVARTLVIRAVAEVAGIDSAVMAHRLTATWSPTAESFQMLLQHDGGETDPARPYPFYLAYPLDTPPDMLGPIHDWQIEWKWDGIRAQMIRRGDHVLLWSRGEELITGSFPEMVDVARHLPDGTVLDGEIVAWEQDKPMPFGMLQRRLQRKRVQPRLFEEVPVVFIAYDLLEDSGRDMREQPQRDRRRRLEAMLEDVRASEPDLPVQVSPLVDAPGWVELAEQMGEARSRGVEGFMLKRLDAPYGVGRQKGTWWKWKVDPYSIDAVLIFARHGSGKRAGRFTDYTFGVWQADELVPVTKAYSGLTDVEVSEVDRFIRRHTIQRFGPVHQVKPELVFEIGFEGIRRSGRHRSGVALRFPRMLRWRRDKKPADADTLETVEALLP